MPSALSGIGKRLAESEAEAEAARSIRVALFWSLKEFFF
jgi:hypothetical protein